MLYSFLRGIVSIYILFALLPLKIFAQSQDINFKHYTVDEGLNNNNVLSIYQDYKGYMWIGTEDGLNKFDGYDFSVFRKEEKNSTTLSNNYCLSIYEDRSNNLWVGTHSGLNLFKRDSNNFERFYFDSAQKYNQQEYSIQHIFEDSQRHLWICSSRGLFQFDRITKKFTKCLKELKEKYHINAERFRDIVEDKENNLWISCYSTDDVGLIQVRKGKIVQIYQNDPKNINSLSSNKLYGLFVDSKNNLWIGTRGGGLNKFDIKNNRFIKYLNNPDDPNTLSSNSITAIGETPDGNIWLNSVNGLNILNQGNNKITRIYSNPDDKKSLLSNNLVALYIDKIGTVWIGSRFGGIDIYDKQYNAFYHYNYIPNSKNSLSFNNISSFAEDNEGKIWIATDGGGLNCFHQGTGKFTQYNTSNKTYKLPNDKTVSVFVDKNNILWVGTWLGGMVTYKIEGDKLVLQNEYPLLNSKINSSNSVFSIYQTQNGDIFIAGSVAGLFKYDKTNNTFIPVPLLKGSQDLVPPIVDCIFEDRIGQLLVGTEDRGLFSIDLNSGKIENFTYKEYSESCFSSTSVFCIHKDKHNLIWIGSDFGLNLFDPVNKTFKVFRENDGLPSNYIYGILEDDHENLWLSTSKGISKVAIERGKNNIVIHCRNYDVLEGLQGLQFNRWAFFKSSKGIMYFGGNNGFNAFCPDSIKLNETVPPVYISGLSLFNKPVLPGPGSPLQKCITETNEINLASKQKVITFQFVAINFINPLKNEYKYKLEGFDKDWNSIGHKREVTYTNLPPGNYVFKVIASNNDGLWNTKGASLILIITPPFWNTLWFKVIVFLAFVSFLAGFYFYKTYKIRHRSELMERLVHERTHEVNHQKEEIEKINFVLTEQKNELEAQTEELQSQAEELYNHSEALEKSNEEIQNQRDDLKKAYEELNRYRDQLEDFVIERTRDLNAAKGKAEESDRLKTAFLANMSHEIRTPLNAIIGFSKLLNGSNFSDKEKIEFSHIIEQNSNYLLSLVDDILDISKIESGIIKLNYIPIKLSEVLNDIDFIYNEEIKKLEKFNISLLFKTNLPAKIMELYIVTDPIRLRQIITNLINNALKYTKAGYVEFGVQKTDNNTLQFYIKDTGLGIKKENIDLIFDRFRKFEESSTEFHRGTGLGLAIVKQLVELMEGRIWVESEYKVGSTFYFTLPVINALSI